jgi:hypothetical protein
MLYKTKEVTGFLEDLSEKPDLINSVAYSGCKGEIDLKKGGSPKTQGYPTMCMKTKGKKNLFGDIRRCV